MVVLNKTVLAMKLIVRERHVPGVTHDVDDLGIAMIEVLMALQDPRTRYALQCAARQGSRVGNETVDVRETDLDFRMQQVRDQKTGPSISRTWVGNEECVIGIYRHISVGNVRPQQVFDYAFNSEEHYIIATRRTVDLTRLQLQKLPDPHRMA